MLLVKDDRIVALEASDEGGRATDRSGEVFSFSTQRDESILKVLSRLGASPDELSQIAYTVADPPRPWQDLLLGVGPLVVFAVVGAIIWRRSAKRGQNPMQSFGQTQARVADSAHSTITFADVAGIDEPLQELQEVVEFLLEPQKFAELGARIPHGVLLVGPPGTGKTLLARAVAGEASVPFFQDLGIGIRGNVRRRWCGPRPRSVPPKPEKVRPASSSSTKLTLWVVNAARDWVTPMMNANKP